MGIFDPKLREPEFYCWVLLIEHWTSAGPTWQLRHKRGVDWWSYLHG